MKKVEGLSIYRLLEEAAAAKCDAQADERLKRKSNISGMWTKFLAKITSFSLCLLSPKEKKIACIRPGELSPNMNCIAFRNRCLRVLRANGWRLVELLSDLRPLIELHGRFAILLIIPHGETNTISAKFDWLEQRSYSAIPLVIVSFDSPDQYSRNFAIEAHLPIVPYWEIHKLADLLPNLYPQ